MNTFSKLLLCCLLVSLTIFGCRKFDSTDVELTDYNAEFAIPLFNTKAQVNDLLEGFDDDTFITLGEDGLITLNYKGEIAAENSTAIFDVIQLVGFEMMDTFVAVYFPLPNSIDIDYADLTAGNLAYSFESYHEEDVDVLITLPQITKNGLPLQADVNVEYEGDTPIQKVGIKDLAGYRLTSTNNDSILVRYEAIRANGMRDTLSNVFIGFTGIEFSYIQGFLGQDVYGIDRDTIEIDFFENWMRGDVYFVDPKVLIKIQNSFGFPIRSEVAVMQIETVNGDILPLESPYEDSIFVDYPALDEVGVTKVTNFEFNKDNSNIAEILGEGPVALDYKLDGIPNPDPSNTEVGFATDTSKFIAQVEVELPFYGAASGFVVFDTISVDTFSFDVDFLGYGEVNYAEFKLISENELPLNVDLQLYFADVNGVVLDSMFLDPTAVIAAAPVDVDGNVISEAVQTKIINVTDERFETLKSTDRLFLRSSFSTTDNGVVNVRLTNDQELLMRMGMKLGLQK